MTIAAYELSRIIEALQVKLTACRTLKGMSPKGCDKASHMLDGATPSDCHLLMFVHKRDIFLWPTILGVGLTARELPNKQLIYSVGK